jgi:hypothetical protein
MSSALFKIATANTTGAGGYVEIRTLMKTAKEPEWSFLPYTREDVLGNGTIRGSGYPMAEWHFGYLTQTDYDALRVYCTGKSASVYVVTKTNANTYGTYSATLVWPDSIQWQNGKAIDITAKFIKLVAV